MQTYLVGGAVRDKLLQRPITDRDWVVVGGTSEKMLAQGYQAVGADFPVFLHPKTKEGFYNQTLKELGLKPTKQDTQEVIADSKLLIASINSSTTYMAIRSGIPIVAINFFDQRNPPPPSHAGLDAVLHVSKLSDFTQLISKILMSDEYYKSLKPKIVASQKLIVLPLDHDPVANFIKVLESVRCGNARDHQSQLPSIDKTL